MIGIVGSVVVGKSIMVCLLKVFLLCWENYLKVELIIIDGFLYFNKVLIECGIMYKKGFFEFYDICCLVEFVFEVKVG